MQTKAQSVKVTFNKDSTEFTAPVQLLYKYRDVQIQLDGCNERQLQIGAKYDIAKKVEADNLKKEAELINKEAAIRKRKSTNTFYTVGFYVYTGITILTTYILIK